MAKISDEVLDELLQLQDDIKSNEIEIQHARTTFDYALLQEMKRLDVKGLHVHVVCLNCGVIRHSSNKQCLCEKE